MNKVFVGIMILLLVTSCKEQKNGEGKQQAERVVTNETEKNIYRDADSMMSAFKRKDWIAFVRYNHPNMTKIMGGQESFASFINLQMKQIPDTAIKSISVGKILQVVITAQDQQCVVEQNMKMELNGTKMDKTTYLVGQSLDDGKTWTFFDASTKTALSPKDIMPNISSQLKIPETKKSVQ